MPTDTPPPVASPIPAEQAHTPSSKGILIALGMIMLMCATAYLVYTRILSPSGKIYATPAEFPQIKEGTLLTLILGPAKENDVRDPNLVAQVLHRRLTKLRLKGYSIAPDGPNRVLVQFPADSVINDEVADSFFRQGKIELRLVHPNSAELIRNRAPHERVLEPGHTELAQSNHSNKSLTPEDRAKKYEAKETFVVSNTGILTNSDILEAFVAPGGTSEYNINIQLQSASGARMQKFTAAHIGSVLAFVVDGDVLSAPIMRGELGKNFQITGKFSQSDASTLANRIQDMLPCKLELGGMAPFSRNADKAKE